MNTIETANNFDMMGHVGSLTSICLNEISRIVKPGISTLQIDRFVRDYANDHGLRCATEGYRGFPAACCTSVNHVICHGIPSERKILHNGDIIKVDITFVNKEGWHGDSCRTFAVGDNVNPKVLKLIDVTYQAMMAGIAVARPKYNFGDIGMAIQKYVEPHGFSIVRDFVAHGIGQEFHCAPSIPHYYAPEVLDTHRSILPGMTFTIEPMITIGRAAYKTLSDKWTVVTRDRSWAAQFEHTIGVTENGNVIFT